ncbi:gap junction alpha-4 protein [Menidia menidia]
MSRADWSFLEHLLEEGQECSTAVGRVWLTVLLLFRVLVLGAAAESAWADEQADFVCNTRQPGCTAVCYDSAFPISHFRYFVLQVIFVSTPTIFYFGYVAVRTKGQRGAEAKEEKQAGRGGSKGGSEGPGSKGPAEEKQEGITGRRSTRPRPEAPRLKGRLLAAYALSILMKILLEAGLIAGLWLLYGGFFIAARFECRAWPCPHTVDCFVSRPTEKTVFTLYTQAIAALSLLLNVVELVHLLMLAAAQRLEKGLHQDPPPRPERGEGPHLPPPEQGGAELNPDPGGGTDTDPEDWGPAECGGDLLPTYMNYMGAVRKTYSPRAHRQKHHAGKSPKGAHRGHSRLKHYV